VAPEILQCRLTTPELRVRKASAIRALDAVAQSRSWHSDQLTLAFAPELATLADAMEFIRLERECCPFVSFTLNVSPTRTTLTISGPPGTEPFLRDLGFSPA
jgi:hypothetical protein